MLWVKRNLTSFSRTISFHYELSLEFVQKVIGSIHLDLWFEILILGLSLLADSHFSQFFGYIFSLEIGFAIQILSLNIEDAI